MYCFYSLDTTGCQLTCWTCLSDILGQDCARRQETHHFWHKILYFARTEEPHAPDNLALEDFDNLHDTILSVSLWGFKHEYTESVTASERSDLTLTLCA